MIHKHTRELGTDGAVEQCRQHRGIHPSGQSQQDLVAADLGAHPRHAVLDDVAGGPIRRAAGNLAHESPQDFAALQGMRNLRMKLQAVQSPRLVGHGGERRIVARADGLEPRRRRDHAIAVTHPHIEYAAPLRVAIVLESI